MTEVARLKIDAIAAGGHGVGRLNGMAVFVPRTAPGDEVEVDVRRHKRYAEGRLRRVLAPGPARVTPLCPHYDDDGCGGCQLQHLSLEAQREAKRDIVRQALRRIARREVEVDAVVPSPDPWHYRRRLTVSLRRIRGAWRGGLRSLGAPDEIFALGQCRIAAEPIGRAWRELLAASAYLPETGELRAELRVLEHTTGLRLEAESVRWEHADRFAELVPSIGAIRLDAPWERRIVKGDVQAFSLGAFEQVNAAVASLLQDAVVAAVLSAATPVRRVVDAYGGRGDLSVRLASPERTVTLIELDAEAARVAQGALGDRARVVCARVEDVIGQVLPADLVLLNPPRAGLDGRVCQTIENDQSVQQLVYVSCDPATLARDLERLPSWRVKRVTPFDMFPHTAHVETLCLMDRLGT